MGYRKATLGQGYGKCTGAVADIQYRWSSVELFFDFPATEGPLDRFIAHIILFFVSLGVSPAALAFKNDCHGLCPPDGFCRGTIGILGLQDAVTDYVFKFVPFLDVGSQVAFARHADFLHDAARCRVAQKVLRCHAV